jgi:hypothetical protein
MTSKSPGRVETEIVFVPIKNLSVVWVQAQRPFNPKWSQKIADNFDTDKFDPPVITKPNGIGQFHIVEGQHRVHAAKIQFGENEQLRCRMVDADEPARAAEIWLGINAGRKAIQPVQKFIVAVTANREPETEINAIVNKLGYYVSSAKTEKSISAVSSMIEVHQKYSRLVLIATLTILDKTWHGDASAFGGALIKGYALFINEFGAYLENKRLAEAICKAFTPAQLLAASRLYSEQNRVTVSEGISETLRLKYNRGMKDDASRLKKK